MMIPIQTKKSLKLPAALPLDVQPVADELDVERLVLDWKSGEAQIHVKCLNDGVLVKTVPIVMGMASLKHLDLDLIESQALDEIEASPRLPSGATKETKPEPKPVEE